MPRARTLLEATLAFWVAAVYLRIGLFIPIDWMDEGQLDSRSSPAPFSTFGNSGWRKIAHRYGRVSRMTHFRV